MWFNVDMHYHLGWFAKCACIHHVLICCHRAKVAMLTAKIESTMPRPQRTALNEAPSSLVFGWRSSIQAVWVAILCNDPYASGTFLGWELRYRVRKKLADAILRGTSSIHLQPKNPSWFVSKEGLIILISRDLPFWADLNPYDWPSSCSPFYL